MTNRVSPRPRRPRRSSSRAGSLAPGRRRPARPPGALIEYHSSDGFSYNDDLVLGPSGRGSLCWGRAPGGLSGRVSVVVGTHTLDRLTSQLGLVYCDGESPKREQPEGADMPVTSLAYDGPEVACGDWTVAEREDAFNQACKLVARLVVEALREQPPEVH